MEPKDNRGLQFDFLPLTVSIETLGGISSPIVLRGTPLPTRRSLTFSTAVDNQEAVEVEVFLGERTITRDNMPIGSCSLKGIPPAPKGQPQIRLTFEVDRSCNVRVEAAEMASGTKTTSTLKVTSATLTDDLVQKLVWEAHENRDEDNARRAVASAELRIRRDQERGSLTETTRKMETLVAEIGVHLMEGDKSLIKSKTKELEQWLAMPIADFGDVFDTLFGRRRAKKETQPSRTGGTKDSKPMEPSSTSIDSPAAQKNVLLQHFLESIDPALEQRRVGAWEAVESNRPDGPAQASHSMREVLRQLLERLAPDKEVLRAPWYKKPTSGAPITRAMRIRYAIAGTSDTVSESTVNLTSDLAAAVDSMYAKLSAESHRGKGSTKSDTRVFLSACEAVISLIVSQRHR